MMLQPNRQQDSSQFWRRWFLIGIVAGAIAAPILLAIIPVVLLLLRGGVNVGFSISFNLLLLIGALMIMGGVYSLGQGVAQYLSLNSYIPRMQRSLRANFIGTVVGVAVTGILLAVLLLTGFGTFLEQLGISSALSLILQAFIVGGFGGIAQAIVARSILGQNTEAGYFRWIVPLALLGHVSGGLVGIVASLIISPFLA